MARKKFPDLAEDFAESVPAPVDTPQAPQERPENGSTYISRAVASQIENSRQDKIIENRNLELGMSQGRKGLKRHEPGCWASSFLLRTKVFPSCRHIEVPG